MAEQNALARIDEIADANMLSAVAGGKMTKALAIADAMVELQALLTDQQLKRFASLSGTDIGFRTDRDDKGGYEPVILRNVLIEAVLRGYAPTGNEFNIIAGRFYATQKGLERKVREHPGLTDLKMIEGVPQKMSEGALVEYHAEWAVDGKADRIDCVLNGASDTRIPVRVNSGMGIDAILGKARRKMLARIYARLTGSVQSLGESEVEPEDHVEEAEVVTEPTIPTKQTEEQREIACIACQEAIDIATTQHNVAEAFKEFAKGMPDVDREAMSTYAMKRQQEIAREKAKATSK